MTRVHVWGASGYAAAEAIRLLDRHPLLEVGVLESRSHAGKRVADHFPLLRTTAYRFADAGAVTEAIAPGDIVIAAGGHNEARERVPAFLEAGARVVDLSADYRFDEQAVYGLSEFHADAIAKARLVANPGCYPTATLLALLPLLALATPLQLVVDAKSGITGAGRNPSVGSLYAEVAGDIRAYGLGGHRHQPEIERILAMHDRLAPLVFTPHVVPLSRGMLADCYAIFDHEIDPQAVASAYERAYAGSPFVRIVGGEVAPSVAAVVGTNDAEIRVDVVRGVVRGAFGAPHHDSGAPHHDSGAPHHDSGAPHHDSGAPRHDGSANVVRVICAIDNLGKGAAGQALQNINLMLGYPQETGFDARAVIA